MPRLVLWFLVMVSVSTVCLAGGQTGTPKLRRAFDFTLPDPHGKQTRLSDYRGQVILLEFFRTGCSICQQEAPALEQLYRDHRNKGLVIIGITHEQGAAEAIPKYAEQFGITHPLLLGDLEVAVRYLGLTPQRSSFHTPHFFLIDREGYLVREWAPERDPKFFQDVKKALELAFEEAMALPAPGKP